MATTISGSADVVIASRKLDACIALAEEITTPGEGLRLEIGETRTVAVAGVAGVTDDASAVVVTRAAPTAPTA